MGRMMRELGIDENGEVKGRDPALEALKQQIYLFTFNTVFTRNKKK
jgi:hypothetical protein